MRNARRKRCPSCLLLLFALAPGCQAFYSYRPATVEVRDVETKQPISGAEVRISYPLTPAASAPWDSCATTGADGIARLRAAPFGDAGILLEATAPGYQFEEKNLSVEAVRALEPTHLFEPADPRPVAFVLEMYAQPRPTIELVLPGGYRGVVRARVRAEDAAPTRPGERLFRVEVPPSGDVEITGPALLRRVLPTDFRARLGDGPILSREAKVLEVGFWWLRSEDGWQLFFVGTGAEYDECRRDRAREERTQTRTPASESQGRRRDR